jgi:hypothetical protein
MKRAFSAVLVAMIWIGLSCGKCIAQSSPIFVVHQPTIIAFFPITQAEVDSSADDTEALGDFDHYVSLTEKRLHSAGVAIHLVNARSFQLRIRGKSVTYQPKDNEIGYYFIVPGKEPHIEHDVMTDQDILAAARKYFKIVIH